MAITKAGTRTLSPTLGAISGGSMFPIMDTFDRGTFYPNVTYTNSTNGTVYMTAADALSKPSN